MTKTTESGYMLTLEVWLPANPAVPGEMAFAAEALGNANHAEIIAGTIRLVVTEPARWRWLPRRKFANPASITPATAEPTAQEEPAAEAPSPSAAGDIQSAMTAIGDAVAGGDGDLLVIDRRAGMKPR